jgi:hypothetical protein
MATLTTPLSTDFATLAAASPWPLTEVVIPAPRVNLGRAGVCMLLRAPVANGLALVQPCNWSTVTPAWSGTSDGPAGPVVISMIAGSIPPLPVSAQGFPGTPTWDMVDDDVFLAADVDGDGIDEIVVFEPTNGWLGVLKWWQGALYLWWAVQTAVPLQAGGQGIPWAIGPGDTYLAARFGIGPAGAVSIVACNAWNGTFGVLSWTSAGLVTVSQLSGSVYGPGGASWPLSSADQVSIINLTGDGTDAVLFYTTLGALGVLQWDAGSGTPQLVWSASQTLKGPGGSWPFDQADQHVIASLDGKTQSLVLFSPPGPTIGVAQWDAGTASLQLVWTSVLWLAPNPTQGFQWQMHSDDVLYAAALPGGGVDWIFFVDVAWLGAASWDGTQLVSAWQIEGAVPGSAGVNPWNRSSSDLYWPIPSSAAGQDQLLVVSPGDNLVGLLAWDGSAVTSSWQALGMLPGWGPGFVASGPQLGYPPFVDQDGSQVAEVYAYISSAADPGSNGDLRAQYVNTNDAATVATWYSWLVVNSTPPDSSGFSQADWSAVQSTLLGETQALTVVYDLYGNLSKLADSLQNQQAMDLSHVMGLVAPDSGSQVSYWVGQLVIAVIWGAAACAGDFPAIAASASMFASLAGAGLGGDQGPQLIDYLNVNSTIDAEYAAMQKSNGLGQNLVSGDAIKASIIFWIAQGAWTWPSTDTSTMAEKTQTSNRIAFYQMLLPTTYQILWCNQENNISPPYIDVPSYAMYGQRQSDGTWNVYFITAGIPEWPTQDMMSDIWGLGVQPPDFYFGMGGWIVIPHVAYSNPGAPHGPGAV